MAGRNPPLFDQSRDEHLPRDLLSNPALSTGCVCKSRWQINKVPTVQIMYNNLYGRDFVCYTRYNRPQKYEPWEHR